MHFTSIRDKWEFYFDRKQKLERFYDHKENQTKLSHWN